VIKATGSTATETGIFAALMVIPFDRSVLKLESTIPRVGKEYVSLVEDIGEFAICPDACEFTPNASLLIFGRDGVA